MQYTIFIIGGRILYKTVAVNLLLLSLSTIGRTVYSHSGVLLEGAIRAEEFKEILRGRNLPSYVWLSENTTSAINRVQYDDREMSSMPTSAKAI